MIIYKYLEKSTQLQHLTPFVTVNNQRSILSVPTQGLKANFTIDYTILALQKLLQKDCIPNAV